MEALKGLLIQEDKNQFSVMTGSKFLGEVVKDFPKLKKNFEQSKVDKVIFDVPADIVNDSYEVLAGFSDETFSILADMFVKVKELHSKNKIDERLSFSMWLAGRMMAVIVGCATKEAISEVHSSGYKMPEISITGAEGLVLSEEDKLKFINFQIVKTISDLLKGEINYAMLDILDSLYPRTEKK